MSVMETPIEELETAMDYPEYKHLVLHRVGEEPVLGKTYIAFCGQRVVFRGFSYKPNRPLCPRCEEAQGRAEVSDYN